MATAEKAKKPDALVVDTNSLIHHLDKIEELRLKGNKIIIPLTVIKELDRLKGDHKCGYQVRTFINKIFRFYLNNKDFVGNVQTKDNILLRLKSNDFEAFRGACERSRPLLDPEEPDHQIIASAYCTYKENIHMEKFYSVTFMTGDKFAYVIAGKLGLRVEYLSPIEPNFSLPLIRVHDSEILDDLTIRYDPSTHDYINENCGAYGSISKWTGKTDEKMNKHLSRIKDGFALMRKKGFLQIIPPDIDAMGIAPYSLPGQRKNWRQNIFLHQLFDPDIQLVLCRGKTGSGKTLLAMAAALEQLDVYYGKIVLTSAMVPVGGIDRVKTVPGGELEKTKVWAQPFWDAMVFIASKAPTEGKRKEILEMVEKGQDGKGPITFVPFDNLRSINFKDTFLILDEAQNATFPEVKAVLTRLAASGGKSAPSKGVVLGDMFQIDNPKLDRESNGLARVMKCMANDDLTGLSVLTKTVRGELARRFERLLR